MPMTYTPRRGRWETARWMVITSLKGKRSQGVGAPAWGPWASPARAQYSTGIYIRKLFTSAHDEICQGFVPSAAQRSSTISHSLSLSLSLCLLLFLLRLLLLLLLLNFLFSVFFSSDSFSALSLSRRLYVIPHLFVLTFLPHEGPLLREIQNDERRGCLLLSRPPFPPRRRVIISRY